MTLALPSANYSLAKVDSDAAPCAADSWGSGHIRGVMGFADGLVGLEDHGALPGPWDARTRIVAIIRSFAGHMLAEVLARTHSSTVALVVHGDRAQIVANRTRGGKGIAALPCGGVALSELMARSRSTASHAQATAVASTDACVTLVLDGVGVTIVAR